MKQEENRRKHRRLGLDFGIQVFEHKGDLLGLAKNISLGGCFLETKQQIKNKVLAFELPDTLETVYTPYKVQWENDKGVGIEFNLDQINKKVLFRFMNDWSVVRS